MRRFDASRLALHFYAAPMAEAVRVDASNPKWIQLCEEGDYVYRGQSSPITGATFDEMIANFRAHAAYRADGRALFGRPPAEVEALVLAGGYGVIALNFDHQDAPRPGRGWFLEVERRGTGLWGLCFFDADAHAGMVGGKWRWTSIEWQPASVDNRGAEIGAYLSGVALTNDPFVTGMVPIQMSRPGSPGPVVWFGPARDVLCELRCAFGLPETADVGAVIGEVAKLRAWSTGQTAPPLGVDVGRLVGQIRSLLNLPTLTEPASIFAELDKLLGALADEQEKEAPMNAPAPPLAPPVVGLARLFAARLSAVTGTAVADDDASVLRAFDGYSARIDQVMGHVTALNKIFGTDDPAQWAPKLAELSALQAKFAEIIPEMVSDAGAEETAESAMASQDVAQVMAAQRIDPKTTPGAACQEAFMMQRMGGIAPRVPAVQELAGNPGAFVAFMAARRTRREALKKAGEDFRARHGTADLARLQESLPAHLRGALLPALFAGNGAVFGPNAGQGTAPPPPPPAGVNAPWTMARINALPGSGDVTKRLARELNTLEFGGKAVPGSAAHDALWLRVNEVVIAAQRADARN